MNDVANQHMQIKSKGFLHAIVISHPHYYTTHVTWADTFGCAVYMHGNDHQWLCRKDPYGWRWPLENREVLPGVTAVNVGGHFPGSLVLHWERKLFIADSLVTVPVSFCLVRD